MKRILILFFVILVTVLLGACKKSPAAPGDPATPLVSPTSTMGTILVVTQDPSMTNTPSYTVTLTASCTAVLTATSTPTTTEIYTATISPTQTDSSTVSPTFTCTTTPDVNTPDHFTIKAPGGVPLSGCVAGNPFTVSITAWADAAGTIIATGFDARQAPLSASNNYSSSWYCINPTWSTLFNKGYASFPVTMYRSSLTGATVRVTDGVITSDSDQFIVKAGPENGPLLLVDGMIHEPGLNYVGIPGYKGYYGNPNVVEAGVPFSAGVLITDNFYNRVTVTPNEYPRMTSSDPLASVNGISASGGVYVTAAAGAFNSDNFILRTCGTYNWQYITASYWSNNTSPPINIRHTTVDHLVLNSQPGPVGAGMAFVVTVTAVDIYGNVCDYINGGIPFNWPVDAVVCYSNITVTPQHYFSYTPPMVNGVAVCTFRFGAEGTDCTVRLSAGGLYAIAAFGVVRGAYNKIEMTASGQTLDPGNMDTGVISGGMIAATAGADYSMNLYACDDFGNIDASINTFYLINSTDAGAAINGGYNQAYVTITAGTGLFNINFSTPAPQTITVMDANASYNASKIIPVQ